jgi:glycosyltransferase involved in cell wall biosynthesis
MTTTDKQISICTTIKNRTVVETDHGTRYLFKKFLQSIAEVNQKEICRLELVVCDFDSTDIQDMQQYIYDVLGESFQLNYISLQEKFNRGKGANLAISNASFDNILLLDVDMTFDSILIENVIEHTILNKSAYFPICYSFENDPTEQKGFWLEPGYGNFSITKECWLQSNKIPEYTQWGKEDSDFHDSLQCSKVREQCKNLIHQWHPSSMEWKNRYY